MAAIVILGGGTAGTITANRIRRLYADDVRARRTTITVIDHDCRHIYQPGLLLLPFGLYDRDQIVRPRKATLHPDVIYIEAEIARVDRHHNVVELADRTLVGYSVLIVATGARTAPERTPGLTGAGWRERIFDFYTFGGAAALRDALERFTGGRLVINIVDLPIKSPFAPLEFAFLADWYFTRRGIRDRVEITYVTPLDAAFTAPIASQTLARVFEEKDVSLVSEFFTARVDGTTGTLHSGDGRTVSFDLLVTVPLHLGAEFIARSPGLGDARSFVRTDPHTLQAEAAPNIFAIGDAANLPATKVGSAAHYEADVLVENVRRYLGGETPAAAFDGRAHCFVETGNQKAFLLDLDYEIGQRTRTGMYPVRGVGPLRRHEESRINHLGKRAFRWMYWNLVLPGLEIPGVDARAVARETLSPPTPTTGDDAARRAAGSLS